MPATTYSPMLVWGGHSCPPPLSLGLFLICLEAKDKIDGTGKAKSKSKARARAKTADRSVRSTQAKHFSHQRKRPRSFLNGAFLYAGNYLLSHTRVGRTRLSAAFDLGVVL